MDTEIVPSPPAMKWKLHFDRRRRCSETKVTGRVSIKPPKPKRPRFLKKIVFDKLHGPKLHCRHLNPAPPNLYPAPPISISSHSEIFILKGNFYFLE